ncbi:MAG: hypothetical protein LBF97_06565 [Elusimicrobiota bacterium]|jgi:hypothetical protein|nr:hypothetical protein [Elusimicrobiota bacterium]
MEEEQYGYIYRITIKNENSSLNNYYYIGQHKEDKKEYYGSGAILKKYIKKNGVSSLQKEILYYCKNEEELNLKEEITIGNKYDTDKLCLNLKSGGYKQRLSKKLKEKLNQDKAFRVKCLETGQIFDSCIKAAKYFNLSDDTISSSLKKRDGVVFNYHFKYVNDNEEEILIKDPILLKREKANNFFKKNNPSKNKFGCDSLSAKKIINLTTGEIFDSLIEAVKFYGFKSSSHISQCCNNKRNSAFGFKWSFKS